LDQYINLLKISSVLEIFNSMGGENKKWCLFHLFLSFRMISS
jgi:hypothetical protein